MSKAEKMGRKLRARDKRRYTEEFGDEEIEGARMFDVEEKLVSDKFDKLFVKEMKGEELNLKYIQEHGFDSPIVVKNAKGLGLKMPDSNFTVADVKQCVGSRRTLDVMDVTTQKDFEMTMKEWCQYYENPVRDKLLNVISLEFSLTKLDPMIESPTIVRQVDWVDWVWPRHLKLQQTVSTNSIGDMKYPKVQKYCLMSVKGCYTDFHIDFGGTSVWYHILKGQKVFWLIPPSERNIQLFEQWVLSGKQSDIFFGDTVEQCARIRLYDGYTFFIPTGWIHAVFTSEDSLVFGGNFLHSFAIEKQLRIAQVEDITKVPAKFRYPFYHEMLWYVLERYVYCLTGKSHLSVDADGSPNSENSSTVTSNLSMYSNNLIRPRNGQHVHLTSFELNGLKAIIMWLGRLTGNKRSVPNLIQNPEALLNDAKLLVDDHGNDNHKLAVTGQPLLFWNLPKSKQHGNQVESLSNHLNSSLFFPSILSSPFSSSITPNSASSLSTSSSLLSSYPNCTTSSNISSSSTSTSTASSSSNLSITAQLRQIKNTSFTSAFHLSKSTATTPQSETSNRPESPPTRPISSNQYSINLTQLTKPLDQIPQSFAQLIAATGVGNQNRFNSPLLGSNNNSLVMSYNNNTSTTISTATIPNTSMNMVNSMNSEANVSKPNTDTYVLAVDSSDFSSGDMSKGGKIDLSGGKNNPLNDSARRRRTRCKKCEACLQADCGDCHFCRDMKKFGGPGRMKQSCIARQCLAPVLPHTACCIICGKDGWERMIQLQPMIPSETESQSSLLECSKCWEIVHPTCLKEKNPSLDIEGVMSDELPNSWECPKCIESIKFMTNAIKFNASKMMTTLATPITTTKPSNFSLSIEKPFIHQNSSNLKAPPTQDVYDFHTDDMSPETTCKRTSLDEIMERRHLFEENNNSFKNSETTEEDSDSTITSNSNSASNNGCNSGSLSGKDKKPSLTAFSSTNNSVKKASDSHVRSCARFPLLQKAIKKQSQEKKLSETEKKTISPKSSSGPSSTTKGSRTSKKNHQSARDRLFKSLKGLKKNSEMVRFGSNYSGSSALTKKLSFKSASPNGMCSSNTSNGPSNTSSPILFRSNVESPASTSTPPPIEMKPLNSVDIIMKEPTKEPQEIKYEETDQYMFNDDTDNEIDEDENSIATSCDTNSFIEKDCNPSNNPPKIVEGTKSEGDNLIKPKYVVRPAPLVEDLSDDDETEEGTDVDDTSEDESERSKAKKKYVKKLNRKIQGDLNIAREVILPVFRFLPLSDLMKCMLVCRKWNTWSMDPVLWKHLELTRKKITYFTLIGIVRRQPLHLNLSWTDISKRQLAWLMARLPQLQTLNLTGSSAVSISALCSCNCPLLKKIDLSWVDSLTDTLIKDLLSSPSDSRPGLLETKTRLRLLNEISVAGSDISDVSIRLLCNHLPQLSRIDLSNCQKVTDMGVGFLGASKTVKLVSLNLSSCSNISDTSLETLKRCSNLVYLDLRDCSQVSTLACQKFIATSAAKTKLMMKQFKLIVARNQVTNTF